MTQLIFRRGANIRKKFLIDDVQVTATAAEINKLDGAGANVTAVNLDELTGAGDTSLHTHALADGASDLAATQAEVDQALSGISANVTQANLDELTGAGGTSLHTHALAQGASDVTATATQVNSLARDAGKQAVAVIDINTGAAEAACSVTIGGVEYLEADAEDLPNGVWTNGASAADSATSLAAAINGDTRSGGSPFTAIVSAAGESVIILADAVGTAGNAAITTTSATRVTVENAHGGAAAAIKRTLAIAYVVTDQDVLAGEVNIPVPFTPTAFVVQYTATDGALKAATGTVEIASAPNRILFTEAGGTALIAGDVIRLVVFE